MLATAVRSKLKGGSMVVTGAFLGFTGWSRRSAAMRQPIIEPHARD